MCLFTVGLETPLASTHTPRPLGERSVLATFRNNGACDYGSLLSQGRHSETNHANAIPAVTADRALAQPLNARQYPGTTAQLDKLA
jgi:hypothetical protein